MANVTPFQATWGPRALAALRPATGKTKRAPAQKGRGARLRQCGRAYAPAAAGPAPA